MYPILDGRDYEVYCNWKYKWCLCSLWSFL